MNDTQTIFTVFYAIFWGHISGVLPRWKAFHFAFILKLKQARNRLILSFLLLNIAPFLFFSGMYILLGYQKFCFNDFNLTNILSLFFYAIIPAFSNFGFYHLWIGIIEKNWEIFYVASEENLPYEAMKLSRSNQIIEPTRKDLSIKKDLWHMNIILGILYFFIASLPGLLIFIFYKP